MLGTKEQLHKFAKDNIALLYAYYKAHKIYDEDLKADLALSYWNAILNYDENGTSSFSNYLHKVLGRRIFRYVQYNSNVKRTLPEGAKLYNLEYVVTDDGMELSELIGYEDATFELIECDDVIEHLSSHLPPMQEKILKLVYNGHTHADIAKMTGTSRQNISKHHERIQNFAHRQLYKEMMLG
jgi:RNA polymerase sigma factor (sigma-70 family)